MLKVWISGSNPDPRARKVWFGKEEESQYERLKVEL